MGQTELEQTKLEQTKFSLLRLGAFGAALAGYGLLRLSAMPAEAGLDVGRARTPRLACWSRASCSSPSWSRPRWSRPSCSGPSGIVQDQVVYDTAQARALGRVNGRGVAGSDKFMGMAPMGPKNLYMILP